MPKSDTRANLRTPKCIEEPITARTKVKSPKTGKLITIATAVRQGFMTKTLEWADNAFSKETQREKDERLQNRKLLKFIIEDNHDLRPLWSLSATSPLGAVIKKEDGRFRLWLEIREDTTWKGVEEGLKHLLEWKRRLVKHAKARDPQPHPIPMILAQLKTADPKTKHDSVAKQLNSWIAGRLYTREKADRLTCTLIDAEIFGVLRLFDLADAAIHHILITASYRIQRGLHPWERAASPVTSKALKSISRTWKKRGTYQA